MTNIQSLDKYSMCHFVAGKQRTVQYTIWIEWSGECSKKIRYIFFVRFSSEGDEMWLT